MFLSEIPNFPWILDVSGPGGGPGRSPGAESRPVDIGLTPLSRFRAPFFHPLAQEMPFLTHDAWRVKYFYMHPNSVIILICFA